MVKKWGALLWGELELWKDSKLVEAKTEKKWEVHLGPLLWIELGLQRDTELEAHWEKKTFHLLEPLLWPGSGHWKGAKLVERLALYWEAMTVKKWEIHLEPLLRMELGHWKESLLVERSTLGRNSVESLSQ